MNVYVWGRIKHCSTAYHQEGGVVVFADTEDEARVIFDEYWKTQFVPFEYPKIMDDEKPDHVRSCADGEKMIFIFPDAGCC